MMYKCRLGFGAVMMQVEVSDALCLERLALHGMHLMPVGSACVLMIMSITTITTIVIILTLLIITFNGFYIILIS